MSVNRPLTGFRLVELRYGDTLQELAARELGDANKWRDIIAINDLLPPYVTADSAQAGPRVKLFGQMILVPAVTATVTAEADPAAVFGVDIALTNGLLTSDGGDLKLVSGHANLKQALTHRVRTPLRDLLFHLYYGCGVHRLVGKATGGTAAQLGNQYVRGALLADPRVANIESVTSSPRGDVMPITATVNPIVGGPIEVSL